MDPPLEPALQLRGEGQDPPILVGVRLGEYLAKLFETLGEAVIRARCCEGLANQSFSHCDIVSQAP